MALVLRQTGDSDGAIAAGRQALELAAELGESVLQVRAAHHLGQVYWAIGDFGRAAELLQQNVEAADREAGTSSTDLRIESRAWLARTLSVLGAFAEGRRHGEEALRLATLDGRGRIPIIVHGCLGDLYLAQGDLGQAIRVLEQGLALGRASGYRAWSRVIMGDLGSAYALQERLAEGRALLEEAIREDIRTGVPQDHARRVARLSEVCRLEGHGEEAGHSTRARRSTWPGSSRNAGTRGARCTSLALSMPTLTLPMPRRPKPTTSRPWPSPRNWACARSWPTATSG
jgi:tetratricopeptide (TPR) repeat protein